MRKTPNCPICGSKLYAVNQFCNMFKCFTCGHTFYIEGIEDENEEEDN